MRLPIEWNDLKDRLQARIADVLPAIGIIERQRGSSLVMRSPLREDHNPSFAIYLAGERAGRWKDFATGETGDIFDLIGALLGLREKWDAYWWACAYLGIARNEVEQASPEERDRAKRNRDRRAAQAREESARYSARLKGWWLRLQPIDGTVAETYLREARGLPLRRPAPGALRFHPALDHVSDEGEVTTWPAMVAAVVRGPVIVGIHRTWLASDGSGKAPVDTAKKMLGPVRGGVIPLAKGPTGLTAGKADRAGARSTLAVGEGIETCLTVAAARPDFRVWAAGSLSLMGSVEWPPCASGVVLLGENDASPVARKAFQAVEALWRKQAAGRRLEVARPLVGSDFNDWLTAA
ncbi:MAG TPA: toprim domain-containing protein [Caulobacteraceae bacterium]